MGCRLGPASGGLGVGGQGASEKTSRVGETAWSYRPLSLGSLVRTAGWSRRRAVGRGGCGWFAV